VKFDHLEPILVKAKLNIIDQSLVEIDIKVNYKRNQNRIETNVRLS
jgi:hypothetical protein